MSSRGRRSERWRSLMRARVRFIVQPFSPRGSGDSYGRGSASRNRVRGLAGPYAPLPDARRARPLDPPITALAETVEVVSTHEGRSQRSKWRIIVSHAAARSPLRAWLGAIAGVRDTARERVRGVES